MTAPTPSAPLPPECAARTRCLAFRAAAGAAAAALAAAAGAAQALRALAPWQLLFLWLAAEATFAFVWADKLRRFNARPADHRPAGHDGAATARRVFLQLRHHFAFSEAYLSPWFRDAPMHSIKRRNVLDLLAYGCWYRSTAELEASGDMPALEAMVDALAQHAGLDLQDGHTPGLPFMSHLHDDLPASFRPLVFYVCTELIGLVGRAIMWAAGFERHVVGGRVYYTLAGCPPPPAAACRRQGAEAAGQTPVLLLHGVGAGVVPYLGLILKLAGTGRPLVVPEFRHISMRLTDDIPTIEQLVASTTAFLQLMGHEKVHVVAHSYGSLVAARLCRLHPKAVSSLALMDPVCFGMFMPALLRTFLYSFPSSGHPILDLGLYLVSREVHMTATFCREFYWSDVNLWADELPRHTLVYLGGRDRLCEAAGVRRWLAAEAPAARVVFDSAARHGEMLARPGLLEQLLAQWAGVAAAGEAGAAAATGEAGAAAGAKNVLEGELPSPFAGREACRLTMVAAAEEEEWEEAEGEEEQEEEPRQCLRPGPAARARAAASRAAARRLLAPASRGLGGGVLVPAGTGIDVYSSSAPPPPLAPSPPSPQSSLSPLSSAGLDVLTSDALDASEAGAEFDDLGDAAIVGGAEARRLSPSWARREAGSAAARAGGDGLSFVQGTLRFACAKLARPAGRGGLSGSATVDLGALSRRGPRRADADVAAATTAAAAAAARLAAALARREAAEARARLEGRLGLQQSMWH